MYFMCEQQRPISLPQHRQWWRRNVKENLAFCGNDNQSEEGTIGWKNR